MFDVRKKSGPLIIQRIIFCIARVVNMGTSSKRRYRYFVPKAHPGTLEIVPKDRNV